MQRTCGKPFRLQEGNYFPFNCYRPCNPRFEPFDNSELVGVLSDIRSLILSSSCVKIILAGNLNAHFDRHSRFTSMISDHLHDLGLLVLWQNSDNQSNHMIHPADYTYLSISNGVIGSSIIDHFCVSPNLYQLIKEARVIHDSQNLSNHSLILTFLALFSIEIFVSLHSKLFFDRFNYIKSNS